MVKHFDTIIVGGGQAGLSVSYYLKKQNRNHLIFEKNNQPAQVWRNRWDSFTLNTPNWMTRLPGAAYQGDEPDAFMPRDALVKYFEAYIERFGLPINYGIGVASVKPIDAGYLVNTDKGDFQAANVVIAVGLHQQPRIPSFSTNLSAGIHQIHSSAYQNPEMLKPGAVLVVGSAQSGCQIAEELYQSGRKVYLSVSSSFRLPRRYRGKDMTWWLSVNGFMDRTVDELPSPKARFAASVHSTGKNGGHTINLYQFAKDGVVLMGHIKNMQEDRISMVPDLKENLANADKVETDFVKQIDEYIEKSGLDVPFESLPKLKNGFDAKEILTMDLKSSGITNVVWATGFKFNFNFVKLPIFDQDGYPLQKRGVTEYSGLYFVGLPFLHTFKSGLLYGVADDAAYVAEQILSRTHLNELSQSNAQMI